MGPFYHPNGFIDLAVAEPLGSPNQQITLSGARMNGLVIDVQNGHVNRVNVGGRTYQEGVNYRVLNTLDGAQVIQFAPEIDQAVSGREFTSQLQLILRPGSISVGATNYLDDDAKIANHLLTFQANGDYIIQSVPPGENVRRGLSDEAREKQSSVTVHPNGNWLQRESYDGSLGAHEEARGSQYRYFREQVTQGIAYYNFYDQKDRTTTGHSHFLAEKTPQFNVAVVDYDTGQYFSSYRDEDRRNFMAMHNGQWGRVDFNRSFAGDSARFFPHINGKEQDNGITLDVETALQYERQALASFSQKLMAAGVTASPLQVNEITPDHSLPRSVAEALDVHDQRVDANKGSQRR